MEALTRPMLDWHSFSVPFPMETLTGDRGYVGNDGEQVFALAIDALGHGAEASQVADVAYDFLLQLPLHLPLEEMVERCHFQLRGSRGVALCLARISRDGNMSWLGVGNIQAVRLHTDSHGIAHYESMIMRGGVVGDRLPELRATTIPLNIGDTLVLATDGVDYGWYPEYRGNISAEELAMAIMARHFHGKDDAMVLALRYYASNSSQSSSNGGAAS